MLAYYFPPLGGGGVQRTLKHVKYLPDEGFDTIVLTTRLGWSPMRDPTLGAEVPPGTVVIRAREIPLQLVRWGLHGTLRRARLPTTAASYVGWPDEFVGWVPTAAWHALRAIRRYRPDVLYSTSSPISAHLVALLVSRATGIPWVADFRDAWTKNPMAHGLATSLPGLSARLEGQIVRRASYVVVVDECMELIGIDGRHPRLLVIRNGVDPEDVPPPAPTVRGERFRISYIGTLYGAQDAASVFAALRALIDRRALDATKLEVRIVGDVARNTDASLDGLPVTQTGYVDHRAALAEMAAADVLLFYVPAIDRRTLWENLRVPGFRAAHPLCRGRRQRRLPARRGAKRGSLGGAWGPSGDRVCDRAALSQLERWRPRREPGCENRDAPPLFTTGARSTARQRARRRGR